MKPELKHFFDSINQGQSFLFLGQNYMYHDVNKKFYEKIDAKIGISEQSSNVYLAIDERMPEIESALQWIQTEADYATLPDWGKYLALVPWNGVITSSVEFFIEKMFRLELRDVQPVYQFGSSLPYNYKSKQTLHISYLFGCINQNEKGNRPPCSLFDFSSYKANALNLINKIDREFITPMGVLAIDGYHYKEDWITDEILFSMCSRLAKSQVYFFNFKNEYLESIYIKKLVDEGIVVPVEDALISIIDQGNTEGIIQYDSEESGKDDLVISVTGERRIFPKRKNKAIKRSCLVLDDFSFEFERKEKIEETCMFRDFLYRSSIEPVWEAYFYEMNIQRAFEKDAISVIQAELKSDTLSRKPIIIMGQTGTGKSVALGSMAYKFKQEKRHPVLYIDSRHRDVNNADIEEFCSWCNDTKIIVFWDASTHGNEVSQYNELNDYLASKGKKALIVGTSYKLKDEIKSMYPAIYIEAPVEIDNDGEIEDFKRKYLQYSGIELSQQWSQKYDNNFLVALYRLLPSTNYGIRRGLLDEISFDTIDLSEIIAFEEHNTNPMVVLLKNAGIQVSSESEIRENSKISIGRIIKIVSIIGQYGIAVPFDLMYRMMKGEVSYYVGALLDKIDFLHVDTDICGNINIYPRNSLEAQIVANSSAVRMTDRISLVNEIIGSVSERELPFLIELLKAIGPNSSLDNYSFKEYYCEISEAIGRLRVEEGIYNEGTVLQEASYIREYFKNSEKKENIEKLQNAQELLIQEIERLEDELDDSKKKNAYGQFLIELSSNIGSELQYYCENEYSVSDILVTYDKLVQYLEKALVASPDPYYPVDIWAWSIFGLLKIGIPEDKRTELVGTIVSLFEKVVTENPELIDREDYNKRLIAVDGFEEREDLSEDAFNRLLDMKSDAGIYLRARKIVKDIDLSAKIDDSSCDVLKEAISYLEKREFHEIVNRSVKCQYLLFRLYWVSVMKEPPFFAEKTILMFSRENWETLYAILMNICSISKELTSSMNYLLALCECHLGRENDAFSRLYSIKVDSSIGRRRPVLHYILSKTTGEKEAREFTGQLKDIEKERERAQFYFPELRKNLFYYNRDFVGKVSKENDNLNFEGVHIGLSFMGPRVSDL